jgi:hypothetical protein
MHVKKGIGGRKKALILQTLIGLAVLVLAACGGSYGTLKRSADTNNQFESIQISPKYNYYYTGAYYKPNAIIGLIKEYTLISKLWKPVDLTPERLRGWIEQMTNFRGYALRNFGSNILNAQGEMIGVWYSPEDFTTIRMLDDKQLWIYPPHGRPTFGKENAKNLFQDKRRAAAALPT